jgi:hypothetical protein
MGKIRSFCSVNSSHTRLCAFLSIECPLVSELSIIGGVKEEKFKKVFIFWILFSIFCNQVIQKRREYRENPYHHSTLSLSFVKRQPFTLTTSPNRINITPSPRQLITKNINFSSSNFPINKIKGNEDDQEKQKKNTKNWRVNTIISSNKEDELFNNSFTPPRISVSTTHETPKTTKQVEQITNRFTYF